MKKRVLGRSGLQVSEIGLGCNAFGGRIDHEASRKVVNKALDLGITMFDTSDFYGNTYGSPSGSKICLGQLLGDNRKNIILATKFGNERMQYDASTKGGASRRVIMLAVEASLKRLQTDWIDLYQLHKPDPLTPIEETLRALDDLVRQGKVRYIGCSNFSAWPVVEAHWTAKHSGLNAFISCQNECSLLELAFSWLLAHPIVASVIAGATKPEQLELNARAGEWVLTAEDMAQIDSLTSVA